MDGLRAVFERATLSQRLLLFRRRARSKRSNDMTGGLADIGAALRPFGSRRARAEGSTDFRWGSGNR
ncbi:hypothetical protein EFJ98_01980 [Pseudomonas putida]|nr:hypothetical protein EFJ98_01980 [Pseudomonas putida]